MITIDPNKICYIFDVDGTLTEPRQKMSSKFANEFTSWMKDKQTFVATGSDYNKTKDQVEREFFKDIRDSSLISRFLSVKEVANTILYFSSPLSSGTNGASIRVDGGSMGSII